MEFVEGIICSDLLPKCNTVKGYPILVKIHIDFHLNAKFRFNAILEAVQKKKLDFKQSKMQNATAKVCMTIKLMLSRKEKEN